MVNISPATRDDVAKCLDIREAAFRAQAPSAYTSDEVEALLSRDETPHMCQMIVLQQLFVALIDDEIVGLGGWRDKNLYNLYVAPAHMRCGIGSRILRHIEEDFVRAGGKTLFVDAGTYTLAFYESQHYELVNRRVSSDGLAYLEMRKQLV